MIIGLTASKSTSMATEPSLDLVVYAAGSVVQQQSQVYSPEFLRFLKTSDLPPGELKLKVRVPIIFLRNLNPSGLCNATCERRFSTLGWLFERRLNLKLATLESLCKLITYWKSNSKTELGYYGIDQRKNLSSDDEINSASWSNAFPNSHTITNAQTHKIANYNRRS
ncbi:ATP-dependent DNA helicase pif1-like [Rhizophagus irregularis DAOM 181602=DAOM 197198]|nr:ATP-dependent DNA helicase pif1-like [Rhizophagus irregularis DAOM 181602=DAOM 197198]